MRMETADSDSARAGREALSSFQKRTSQKARRHRFAQAFISFMNDVQVGLVVAVVLFAVGVAALFGLRMMGFENEGVALRHIVAGTDCMIAEMVDLAPAKLDEPGYWMHLDTDKDGTSCEE